MSGHEAHQGHDCAGIFAELSGYLDGELTPEAGRELEEHLCGCPPCVEFLQSLRLTVDLCHELQPGAVPRPLTAEARGRLLDACKKMLESRGAV